MSQAKELPKGAGEPVAPPKKKSRFKLIMLLCSLLLFVGGLAGGGYWWLYKRPGSTGLAGLFGASESAAPASGEVASGQGGDARPGGGQAAARVEGSSGADKGAGGENRPRTAIRPVSLPSLTVNLADPGGGRYLKIGMDVEVNAPEAAAEIESQTARVRDAIILLLSSKTVQELSSAEGKLLLKNEVAARLNQILGAQRVVRIYFTEFVIR